jgi:hypothetical protein
MAFVKAEFGEGGFFICFLYPSGAYTISRLVAYLADIGFSPACGGGKPD